MRNENKTQHNDHSNVQQHNANGNDNDQNISEEPNMATCDTKREKKRRKENMIENRTLPMETIHASGAYTPTQL